jgi:oligoendopeptidase F
MTISVNWDLDSIFEGGSESPALADFLAGLVEEVGTTEAKGLPAPLSAETQASWVEVIQNLYELGARLNQISSFVGCLTSQNVKDNKALQLMGQIDQLGARLGTVHTKLAAAFAQQEDEAWNKLVTETDLRTVAFNLNEQRELARKKMAPELEALANELATDGYHGWDRLYGVMAGDKEVTFEGKPISLGQLQNKYMDDPDRAVRQAAFELFEKSWAELAKNCSLALNHQAGFRLTLYKHRGWDSVLQEPLQNNRLTRETLEAMWSVIDAKSAKLLDFFGAKTKLMGLERLSWFDTLAPIGEVTREFTYGEAANFVVDNL